MVGKRRPGRFTLKNERELIAMAANGATASEIAAKFKTSVKTIERKARALGISIRGGRVVFLGKGEGNKAQWKDGIH
jgi:hypothetical protein